jgi:hypothetical protein
MDIIATLSSGYGFWNPVMWLIAAAVSLLVVYLFWLRGEKSYKKGTAQGQPFIGGNVAKEKGALHIRAGNLYWGYTESLKGYYRWVVPLHTGVLNDYVLWFLGVMAFLLVVVVVL